MMMFICIKINESHYIALFVVSGSIKKPFSIGCVNIYFFQSIVNYLFSIDLKVWGYLTLLIWWFINFKQHLSSIWSSIHEEVKQHRAWVWKKALLIKRSCNLENDKGFVDKDWVVSDSIKIGCDECIYSWSFETMVRVSRICKEYSFSHQNFLPSHMA